jgi:3-isopropylmalate/(R)-2-methylmalate dehydratase large subunit
VLDRIATGEAIPIEFFLEGRDATTQQILRAGGLLRYSRTHLARSEERHVVPLPGDARPRTLVEKIIAQRKTAPAGDVSPGEGVFLSADWRFSHDYFTGMCAHFMHEAFGDDVDVVRPEEIVAFKDHLVLARQSAPHVQGNLVAGVDELFAAHDRFVARYGVREHATLPGEPGSEGICHAIMAERYALPGQVVVGTDSHTPHSGALGCLAFGAGSTDIANSWVTGLIRCRVPETIRVELHGELAGDVMARDVVAYLLQTELVRSGGAIGAVFEFAGPGVERMAMDERATLTNMVAEMGGFTGIVAPDETTLAFLRERRGVEFTLESWMRTDPGAAYRHVMTIDCGALTPMVARPGDPGNAMSLSQLDQTVTLDIAFGGSCTAGKRADFDAYHEVLKWAVERGLRVSPRTRMYLQYGTRGVRDYCRERGYLATFAAAGVEMVPPGCGACANCGPGQSTDAAQVSVSSINRNFPGRSGPGRVWLASPYTVAASAICGRLASFGEMKDLAARGDLRSS